MDKISDIFFCLPLTLNEVYIHDIAEATKTQVIFVNSKHSNTASRARVPLL